MIYLTVGVGLFHYLTGTLGVVTNLPILETVKVIQFRSVYS